MLQRREGPDLRIVLIDLIKDHLVRGFAEATLLPRLEVMFEAGAQSLGTIVEGISKRLMNTLDGVASGHKDLERGQFELFVPRTLAEIISLVRKPSSKRAGALHRR